MPKIDLTQVPVREGSSYPADLAAAVEGRSQKRLGDSAGLTQFGANLVHLAPGAASSLRHWHEQQDELLIVTEGTPVLVDDTGETPLAPGDVCAFPAGDPNGHHIVNRSESRAAFLVVGTRTPNETGWYSDHDLKVEVRGGVAEYTRKDGTALDGAQPRVASEPDFDAFSAALSRAILTGDFALYRGLWHLPARVDPRNGTPYRLETEDALRQDLELYTRAVSSAGVTAIRREVLSQVAPEVDTRVIEANVTVSDDTGPIAEAFTTTFRMERRDGHWRLGRMIGSLGHIDWGLGRAAITEDRRFELD